MAMGLTLEQACGLTAGHEFGPMSISAWKRIEAGDSAADVIQLQIVGSVVGIHPAALGFGALVPISPDAFLIDQHLQAGTPEAIEAIHRILAAKVPKPPRK